MGMNKSLQKHSIARMLERVGVSADTIDLEAEIDGSLHLQENIKHVSSLTGTNLTNDQKEEHNKYLDPDYREDMEREALSKYLEQNGIDPDEDENDPNVELGEADPEPLVDLKREYMEHEGESEELFRDILARYEPMDYFGNFLFPDVVGDQYGDIRKAVLLSMTSHAYRGKRSRIHVILVGKAGTGKTEILLWLQSYMGAYFVNAEFASKVGLTGDASGKEITPGVLAEASDNIMCIDELDKMSYKDQNALLQAMEEGRYTIIKGKHRQRFDAEVRVVATANDITKIQRPLMDRFDFVFELALPSRKERAENAPSLIDQFFGVSEEPNELILHAYLRWLSDADPMITGKELEGMKTLIKSYINLTSKEISEMSYRSLELGILRTANALAKLGKRDVEATDVLTAICFKDKSLTHEQKKYLTAIAQGQL